MRTLHFGLRVTDLDRSLAFYSAVGFEIVGNVPETFMGHLTMLKLPGDEFVTIELVHDPMRSDVDPGTGLSHFVITVNSMGTTVTELATRGIDVKRPHHRMARTTSSRRGSPTRTVTGSSWSVAGRSPRRHHRGRTAGLSHHMRTGAAGRGRTHVFPPRGPLS